MGDGIWRETQSAVQAIILSSGTRGYPGEHDAIIGGDPKHHGPGFGFIAIRSDRSWFTGVVKPEAFQ